MGRSRSMFLSHLKCSPLPPVHTWLRLSVLPLTLCLNSVCHGSRTELQPRWLCCDPSIMFYFCVLNCWVRSYPDPLPPFFFDLSFACSRCLVSLVLEVKALPTSLFPQLLLCVKSIHLRAHLPDFCGPQDNWCVSLWSTLPAWLCTWHKDRKRGWGGGSGILSRPSLAISMAWLGVRCCSPSSQSCHCLAPPGPEHGLAPDWAWKEHARDLAS